MCKFDHLLQFWRKNFAVYVSLCKFLLKFALFTYLKIYEINKKNTQPPVPLVATNKMRFGRRIRYFSITNLPQTPLKDTQSLSRSLWNCKRNIGCNCTHLQKIQQMCNLKARQSLCSKKRLQLGHLPDLVVSLLARVNPDPDNLYSLHQLRLGKSLTN